MKIEISRHQYKTLMYWAHKGAANEYRKYHSMYPLRKTPYQKIKAIEDAIAKQGLSR